MEIKPKAGDLLRILRQKAFVRFDVTLMEGLGQLTVLFPGDVVMVVEDYNSRYGHKLICLSLSKKEYVSINKGYFGSTGNFPGPPSLWYEIIS